ncbi:hypothetical protein U9M48_027190 [Paspalum notatum var. saurae]|uniref:Uncharacterized protein n=1 Tax=Paspalum notatum var. saurae TaxID=547442 RepID=A0AAQ3TSF2_PASNO
MPTHGGGTDLEPLSLREAPTVAMADEVKIQIEGQTEVEAEPTHHEDPSQAATTSSSLETKGDEPGAQRPASGAAAQDQAETSSTEREEHGGTAEGERDVQLGAVVAFLSFGVMLPGFSFGSTEAKGTKNWRFDILMLLELASGICGFSFMLLSMHLLGAPEIQVSYYGVISRCLFYACIIFPVLTLLSLLLAMPFKLYLYLGLAVPPLVLVMVGIWHYVCYSRAAAGPKTDAAVTAELKEQQEKMDANVKITGALMTSSFGGLIGTLAGVYKQQSGDAAESLLATHIAVMFMFSTAVVSVLVMLVSIKVMEIKSRELRRSMVGAIRHANIILVCLLAMAAFAAAFVILKFYILTTFVSLAVAAMVHLVINRYTTAGAVHDEEGKLDDSNNLSPNQKVNNQETQIGGWMDIGKQVTALSLGGVMMFFGSFIGDASNNDQDKAANMTCMYLLTSAFASGIGLMLLNFLRARGSFGAAINILVFSALGMVAAAAVAIYGVVVIKS